MHKCADHVFSRNVELEHQEEVKILSFWPNTADAVHPEIKRSSGITLHKNTSFLRQHRTKDYKVNEPNIIRGIFYKKAENEKAPWKWKENDS